MAINKGTAGAIYMHSTSTTFSGEAMTSSAGNIYTITAAKVPFDPNVAVTLDATSLTYLDKTYMHDGWNMFTGACHLSTATSPTVSGAYLILTSLADVISWSLSMNKNTVETTAIGDTWKEYTPVELGATLTINRFYSDSDMWLHLGVPLIVRLWEDGTSGFWCEGTVIGVGHSVAVGQVQNEALTISINSVVSRF